MLRTPARVGMAITGLILCVCAAVYVVSRVEPVPWNGVEVDGRTVLVSYTGGECDAWSWSDVEQDGDRVTITVSTLNLSMSCSDVGDLRVIEVELDAPVGDREIVDGA